MDTKEQDRALVAMIEDWHMVAEVLADLVKKSKEQLQRTLSLEHLRAKGYNL